MHNSTHTWYECCADAECSCGKHDKCYALSWVGIMGNFICLLDELEEYQKFRKEVRRESFTPDPNNNITFIHEPTGIRIENSGMSRALTIQKGESKLFRIVKKNIQA